MQRFHFIDKETESQKIQWLNLASHYAKKWMNEWMHICLNKTKFMHAWKEAFSGIFIIILDPFFTDAPIKKNFYL